MRRARLHGSNSGDRVISYADARSRGQDQTFMPTAASEIRLARSHTLGAPVHSFSVYPGDSLKGVTTLFFKKCRGVTLCAAAGLR